MSAWSLVSHSALSSGALGLGNLLAQAEGATGGAVAGAGSQASAETSAPSTSGGGAGMLNIGMIVVMFAVFYFLVMRPQSKRAKEHTAFLTNLKPNDRVVLRSGIFGKLVSLDGSEAKVEIADRTIIRVYKSQIAGAESQAAEVVDSAQGR